MVRHRAGRSSPTIRTAAGNGLRRDVDWSGSGRYEDECALNLDQANQQDPRNLGRMPAGGLMLGTHLSYPSVPRPWEFILSVI